MALRLLNQTVINSATAQQRTVTALASARLQPKLEPSNHEHDETYLPSYCLTKQPFGDLSIKEAQIILAQLKEEAMTRVMLDQKTSLKILTNKGRWLSSNSFPAVIAHELDPMDDGMGSITSVPEVKGGDSQDEDLEFPVTTQSDLLQRCQNELESLPPAFDRSFRRMSSQHTLNNNPEDDFSDNNLRIFQWNHLSQTLGTKNDKFVKCPLPALDWTTRRWRLLEEIVRYDPDIVCLQEVDHISLFKRALSSIGYSGHFVPKPDSPCIYLPDNNGPDGCAIFYKEDKFEMLSEPASRVVEVWRVQSNQVVLSVNLRHRKTGKDFCVATTHLKARSGALLSTLRNEQGKDILEWIDTVKPVNQPLILCGDFNAEPSEPVFRTMTENPKIPLNSAYKISETAINGEATEEVSEDLTFTTWKIRETGEQKHILDYIFHSSDTLTTIATLDMPDEEQIGQDRLPSLAFASDHLSLVAELSFSSD